MTIVLRLGERKVLLYDSLRSNESLFRKWIEKIKKALHGVLDMEDWESQICKVDLQKDHDCGVFLILYAEFASSDSELLPDVEPQDMLP